MSSTVHCENPRIAVFHNIRWSRYKAAVFSELHSFAQANGVDVSFCQIADTDGQRQSLSRVDVDAHCYPHELLFSGSYSAVPVSILTRTLFGRVWSSPAELVVIPGYDRPEYWAMLLAAMLTGKRRGVFCDSTLRDREQHWGKGLLKRLFFKCCNGYFAYGRRSFELLKYYGANPGSIHQRCQAAAMPLGYSPETALETRIEHAPATDAMRFLYVGRLSQEKAIDVLLRAFKRIVKSGSRAELTIVGDGPLRGDLERSVEDLGLSGSVQFAGGRDPAELAHCYASASCLVLPSWSEPWGLVVNEALHYGCPVVVSDNCGCVPELVVDGVTGYRFIPGDEVDLADKMVRVATTLDDVARVATDCLNVIGAYSPRRAAEQILDGCRQIMGTR